MFNVANKFCTALKTVAAAACFGLVACATSAVPSTSGVDTSRQFDKVSGELVFAAQELAARQKYEEATAKLKAARALPDLIPYEVSTIETMLGTYAYEQDNNPAAIQHYRNSIAANGLLPNEVRNYESNIAQLLIDSGNYTDGAKALTSWLEKHGPDDRLTRLAICAHARTHNYPAAIALAVQSNAQSGDAKPDILANEIKTYCESDGLKTALAGMNGCY